MTLMVLDWYPRLNSVWIHRYRRYVCTIHISTCIYMEGWKVGGKKGWKEGRNEEKKRKGSISTLLKYLLCSIAYLMWPWKLQGEFQFPQHEFPVERLTANLEALYSWALNNGLGLGGGGWGTSLPCHGKSVYNLQLTLQYTQFLCVHHSASMCFLSGSG